MKKKGWVGLLFAVSASLSCGITSMAASGWVQEGNNWAYYNSSGYREYDVWRKGGDGNWRYINGNGVMAVDSWVDNDDYYVDSNGIMVAGKWLQVPNSDSVNGYDWYFFNGTGKCLKERWEKIGDSWYYFDDTGLMQTGWILEDMYYCAPNGVMQTGWQKLDPPEGYEDDEEDYNGPYESAEDGKRWYYFNSNGKKAVPDDDGDNIKQKRINGKYYCLREDGAMETGWVCVTGDESDNIADYRLVDENGQIRSGWYSAEPPEHLQGDFDYDVEWFYFNNKGVPKTGPESGSAHSGDLVKINGNTYLFGPNGVPMYGMQKVYLDKDESEYTAYYFGNRSQSSMLRGKQRIDDGGEMREYYFTSTGRGYTGVYNNYLYYMGKLQRADSGSKYEVFTIPEGNSYKNYVINTSGRIAKSTTVKDRDGVKYKTNSNGVLLEEDGERVDGGTYSKPEEPDWSCFE